MKKIFGLLEWNFKDFMKMIIGSLMFCLAVNIFIVPNELYTGGLLGISQLIRTVLTTTFDLNLKFDDDYFVVNMLITDFMHCYSMVYTCAYMLKSRLNNT